MISTVASRALHAAGWHRSTAVLARVDILRPQQRPSLSAYSTKSSCSYFASLSTTAISRHDNSSNSVGSYQSNRMLSSPADGPSDKQPDERQTSAGNDLQQQFQDMPPDESHPRNDNRGRGPVHNFRQRRETMVASQKGAARKGNANDARTKQHGNTNDNNYANRNNQGRQRWRSKKSSHDNRPRKKIVDTKAEIATSEWIKVSNIPPMSKLSDVFPSLNQIIDYEMQKGIIDLDALDNMGGYDNVTSHALDAVGALNSLYSTQQISGGNRNIPLWTPPSSTELEDKADVFPMILEARLHLSYRARPMGWFLRLPNRSVVNAILNHVRRAENEQWSKWNVHEAKTVKYARKKWREGLWEGVYEEYQTGANKEGTKLVVEDASPDNKESLRGDGMGGEKEKDDSLIVKDDVEEGAEKMDSIHAKEQQNDVVAEKQQDTVEDYLLEYAERHPFPTRSPESSATDTHTQVPEYQLVKSGSTALNIQEFSPYPFESVTASEHPPWEQHSFYISPLLNLSDSVVRVETTNLRNTEEDIQYHFRGYDLEAIALEEPDDSSNSASLQSCYSDFPESIGWNVKSEGNIDLLVKGFHKPERQHVKFPQDRKETVPIGPTRHTFLVRFANSADARMAVREKKGTPRDGYQHLSVTQYPQQW